MYKEDLCSVLSDTSFHMEQGDSWIWKRSAWVVIIFAWRMQLYLKQNWTKAKFALQLVLSFRGCGNVSRSIFWPRNQTIYLVFNTFINYTVGNKYILGRMVVYVWLMSAQCLHLLQWICYYIQQWHMKLWQPYLQQAYIGMHAQVKLIVVPDRAHSYTVKPVL